MPPSPRSVSLMLTSDCGGGPVPVWGAAWGGGRAGWNSWHRPQKHGVLSVFPQQETTMLYSLLTPFTKLTRCSWEVLPVVSLQSPLEKRRVQVETSQLTQPSAGLHLGLGGLSPPCTLSGPGWNGLEGRRTSTIKLIYSSCTGLR